jgi:glutamate racemase
LEFVFESRELTPLDRPDLNTPTQKIQQAPIGVFDSGVGGLTVLKAMREHLPHESFLYFGDTARLPYGTRSQAEIVEYVREILAWMVQEQVKMAVMACNTSSALALDIVRTEFKIPILGIILPGARAAVQKGKRIGVIATPATVASQSYPQAILEINPEIQVWQVACPEFVPLIEQNQIATPETLQIAQDYLHPLLESGIDTLIYGCTHYPHLAPVINQILPRSVRQVDPAKYLAIATVRELELLGLSQGLQGRGNTRFCVSDAPQKFAQTSQQWLGEMPFVEKITLPVTATSAFASDFLPLLVNDSASSSASSVELGV